MTSWIHQQPSNGQYVYGSTEYRDSYGYYRYVQGARVYTRCLSAYADPVRDNCRSYGYGRGRYNYPDSIGRGRYVSRRLIVLVFLWWGNNFDLQTTARRPSYSDGKTDNDQVTRELYKFCYGQRTVQGLKYVLNILKQAFMSTVYAFTLQKFSPFVIIRFYNQYC